MCAVTMTTHAGPVGDCDAPRSWANAAGWPGAHPVQLIGPSVPEVGVTATEWGGTWMKMFAPTSKIGCTNCRVVCGLAGLIFTRTVAFRVLVEPLIQCEFRMNPMICFPSLPVTVGILSASSFAIAGGTFEMFDLPCEPPTRR